MKIGRQIHPFDVSAKEVVKIIKTVQILRFKIIKY